MKYTKWRLDDSDYGPWLGGNDSTDCLLHDHAHGPACATGDAAFLAAEGTASQPAAGRKVVHIYGADQGC
jgi:hypothetical protein